MTTDHFSAHASHYAKSRPSYPPALFEWLASLCAQTDLAWDCGTGNGQAALALAEHFSQILATDLSPQQVAQAPAHPRVEYRVAPAHESGLAARSCDLLTVAQALHWFDHQRFYAEAQRVLRPTGIIAAWTYRLVEIEPAIDALIAHFHHTDVGAWWPPERHWVDKGYQGMPFPFVEIAAPAFRIHRQWSADELLDYLRTWSATQRYWRETGCDPTLALKDPLYSLWGDPLEKRDVSWPLAIRCGRLSAI